MFIGHYGLGFMIKKRFAEIPLWVLFLSVQLMDIIAFILVFMGVEKAAYRDDVNPFFRNNLDLPYSHSLIGALILGVIVYISFILLKRRSWAPVAALCVASHWIIDFIVHTPDLPILFGTFNVGLGLWNYPYLSAALELLLVAAGWLILGYRNIVSYVLLILLIGGFTGMVFGSEPEVMRNSQALRTLMVLASNTLFIALAYFSEKKAESRA